MRKLVIVSMIFVAFIVSCLSSSSSEVSTPKEKLREVKEQLKGAEEKEDKIAKAKENADWDTFKNEADSLLFHLENEIEKLEDEIGRRLFQGGKILTRNMQPQSLRWRS